MEKTRNNSFMSLVLFAYKKYFNERKFIAIYWSYFASYLLISILPIFSNYFLALLIDKTIDINKIQGDYKTFLPVFIFFLVLTVANVIFTNLLKYFEAMLATWRGYLDDNVKLNKYLEIEPQAYEDPEFINEKSTLEWNSNVLISTFPLLVEILALFISVVLSLYGIMRVSPWFVPIAIIASMPIAFITKKFGKRIWGIWKSKGEEKVRYSNYKNSIETRSFEIYQEIFVFNYGKFLFNKASKINRNFSNKLEDNEKKRLKLSIFAFLFSNFIYLGVVAYSVFMVLNGNLSVGMLTFAISTYSKLNKDIYDLFYKIAWAGGNKSIFETFYNLYTRENCIKEGNKEIPMLSGGIEIEFKNVWFKYPGSKNWVLKGINLKIHPDEDFAFVGKNGAGKSTLIKLLLRIYDPQIGNILINGIDLKELRLSKYYSSVGILAQTFNKLSIQAKDNISIGNIDEVENIEKVKRAGKMADIDKDIEKLSHGYNTFLSKELKGGAQLSGGQWQKLAIARAFFRNPKLLILDEPTSAVDALSEEKIFDNIRKNAQGRTTLIVSHRFATVKKAKRIIVVDNGSIVEDGNHEELIKNNGLYASMYKTQVESN